MSAGAAGGAAAGAAAAAARLQQQQEEEEMTAQDSGDPAQYEYKIIRSATGMFKNPTKFRTILHEEAEAGWELLEKFDDARVRLRRHIQWRDRDGELARDPYRIKVGMTENALVGWILLGVFGGIGLIFLVILILAQVLK